MRKYTRLFPFLNCCEDGRHVFKQFGKAQKCIRCQWIKHEEEIEGEKQLLKRMERINSRVEIKTKHISLFHF